MENAPHENTRDRLMAAAGELFAERGYHRASVRDICHDAGVNVAMVKYHFGDKLGLYREVLLSCFPAEAPQAEAAHAPVVVGSSAQSSRPPAATRLHEFVAAQILRVRGPGAPAWRQRLLSREMVEPSPVFAMLVDRGIRPVSQQLRAIVQELLGPLFTPREVTLCCLSIVGQSLHHRHARPVIALLYPDIDYGHEGCVALAEHICRFSLAALGAMRQEREHSLSGAHSPKFLQSAHSPA